MEAILKGVKLLKREIIEKHQLQIELPASASVLMDVTVSDYKGITDIDPGTPEIYNKLNRDEILAVHRVIQNHFECYK